MLQSVCMYSIVLLVTESTQFNNQPLIFLKSISTPKSDVHKMKMIFLCTFLWGVWWHKLAFRQRSDSQWEYKSRTDWLLFKISPVINSVNYEYPLLCQIFSWQNDSRQSFSQTSVGQNESYTWLKCCHFIIDSFRVRCECDPILSMTYILYIVNECVYLRYL